MPRVLVALTALVLLVWTGTASTSSSFTTALIENPDSGSGSGRLAFSHSYGATSCSLDARTATTTACAGSLLPTTAVPAGTGVSVVDSVANTGTLEAAQLTQRASAASCATVQLANEKNVNRPMLPRYATTFAGSGPFGGTSAVTLDGSTAYATSVAQQSLQIPAIGLGTTYGYGVWFRLAADSGGGPLLSFGSNPTASGTTVDRILYVTAAGKLSFVANTSGNTVTQSGGLNYLDGEWHFAYAVMTMTNVLFLGVSLGVTLYVDSTPVASNGSLLNAPSSYGGYWHLGWAPTSKTGLASAYVNGSLSNAVVIDSSPAPSAPNAIQRLSQANFTAWASSATEHWTLGDSGTTTYTGSQPIIGTTSPCATVTIAWAVASPAGTVTATTPLSSFANGTVHTVAAPAPGASQSSTVTLARHASYNAYVSGLRLRVPITVEVRTHPASLWSVAFTWSSADAVVIA
ncbi:MAG: hypothetical protein WB767_08165 [Nocardioides sp.]